MPEKTIIRPIRKADVKLISRMVKRLAAHFGDNARVVESDLHRYCFGKEKLSTIYLASYGGKPAGFAICREWMNFYLGIKFCHIDFIFVEKKFRGFGIGVALIKTVAQNALKAGCRGLSLDVGTDNEVAKNLYKILGFVKRPHISDHYRLSEAGLRQLVRFRKWD